MVAFTTDTPAIDGVFRERYSDFQVHEIDLAGTRVTLTQTAVPEDGAAVARAETCAAIHASPADTAAKVGELLALCGGTEDTEAVAALIAALLARDDACDADPVLLPSTADKTVRRATHDFVKRHFDGALTADTVDDPQDDSRKCVRLWRAAAPSGGERKRKRGGGQKLDVRSRSTAWPRDRPVYLRFALFKENMDTMHAASIVAKSLHVKPHSVGYAGTKDRRAVTTQWFTLLKQTPANVAARLCGRPDFGGSKLRIGDYCFVDEPLKLGALRGNRFEIALREARTADGASLEVVAAAACAAVAQNGFANYFGLQRFGQGGACNSTVGEAILAADWRRAVELVLAPREGDGPEAARAKRLYLDEAEAAEAAELMPRFMRTEKALLEGLARHGSSAHLNALQQGLPKNMQLMYLHAHQSLVWNRVASARVAAHGVGGAVAGDLVLDAGGSHRRVTPDRQAVSRTEQLSADAAVHVVSCAEAAAGTFSAFEVILPLPGHAVAYPSFAGAAEAYVAAGALPPDAYKSERHSEFSLSGAYRTLLARPEHVAWRVVSYSQRDEQLVETDLDRLAAANAPPPPQQDAPADAAASSSSSPSASSSSKHLSALVITFELPSSSYATSCLRELTKRSMSKSHHKALSSATTAQETADAALAAAEEEEDSLKE